MKTELRKRIDKSPLHCLEKSLQDSKRSVEQLMLMLMQ
jgi:hypothetical protein